MPVNQKKKYKPGAIVASPDELAILVHYEKETLTYDDDGNVVESVKDPGVQRVSVESLINNSIAGTAKLEQLAALVVEKNKLISSSKLDLVTHLLGELQLRVKGGSKGSRASSGGADGAGGGVPGKVNGGQNREERVFSMMNEALSTARIDDLDDYVEMLYESSLEERIRGTALVSALFRRVDHLHLLLEHRSLLGAMGRVLRDDHKRSMDLTINICSSIFAISLWGNFHHILVEHQIGGLLLDIVDLELRRTQERANEDGISPAVVAQKVAERQMGISDPSLTERERKLLMVIQKQDRLLYYALYALLNLAMDSKLENKMRKRNIVSHLSRCLDRSNVDLLVVVVMFLKKLSIFFENKDQMVKCDIVPLLLRYVPVANEELLTVTLRLLHNLSFDVQLRRAMVEGGLVSRLVDMIEGPNVSPLVLGLLYHLSMDDTAKTQMVEAGAVKSLREYLLHVSDLRETPELIALVVNLSQDPNAAVIMCEGQGLEALMTKAFDQADDLIFKVVRNISQNQDMKIKRLFVPYVEPLVALLKAEVTSNVLVEVLGTLGNLNIQEAQMELVVKKHDLLRFLTAAIRPDMVEDDILLEVVVFLGTLCSEATSTMIVEAQLIGALMALISQKKNDDEFVLQITFALHKLLLFQKTRDEILSYEEAVPYLVDLLFDNNVVVRNTASKAVDVICDIDAELARKIRCIKFEHYNAAWIQKVGEAHLRRHAELQQRQRQEMHHHRMMGGHMEEEEEDDTYISGEDGEEYDAFEDENMGILQLTPGKQGGVNGTIIMDDIGDYYG